ncbi:MAG: flagellar biosynthesis regulator FlaF [Flavobacteriaceae bacterium]
MQHTAAQAYSKVAKTTSTPRDVEADLLVRAATRLQAARDAWAESQDARAAIMFNRRLWTILATSATSSDNPLPQQIKQNIGNIAVFIFSQTQSIINDPRPEKLNSLISINREIAAGLRSS